MLKTASPGWAVVNEKPSLTPYITTEMTPVIQSDPISEPENGNHNENRSSRNLPSSAIRQEIEIVDLVGDSNEGSPSPPKNADSCSSWRTAIAQRLSPIPLKAESARDYESDAIDNLPSPSTLFPGPGDRLPRNVATYVQNVDTSPVTEFSALTSVGLNDVPSSSFCTDGPSMATSSSSEALCLKARGKDPPFDQAIPVQPKGASPEIMPELFQGHVESQSLSQGTSDDTGIGGGTSNTLKEDLMNTEWMVARSQGEPRQPGLSKTPYQQQLGNNGAWPERRLSDVQANGVAVNVQRTNGVSFNDHDDSTFPSSPPSNFRLTANVLGATFPMTLRKNPTISEDTNITCTTRPTSVNTVCHCATNGAQRRYSNGDCNSSLERMRISSCSVSAIGHERKRLMACPDLDSLLDLNTMPASFSTNHKRPMTAERPQSPASAHPSAQSPNNCPSSAQHTPKRVRIDKGKGRERSVFRNSPKSRSIRKGRNAIASSHSGSQMDQTRGANFTTQVSQKSSNRGGSVHTAQLRRATAPHNRRSSRRANGQGLSRLGRRLVDWSHELGGKPLCRCPNLPIMLQDFTKIRAANESPIGGAWATPVFFSHVGQVIDCAGHSNTLRGECKRLWRRHCAITSRLPQPKRLLDEQDQDIDIELRATAAHSASMDISVAGPSRTSKNGANRSGGEGSTSDAQTSNIGREQSTIPPQEFYPHLRVTESQHGKEKWPARKEKEIARCDPSDRSNTPDVTSSPQEICQNAANLSTGERHGGADARSDMLGHPGKSALSTAVTSTSNPSSPVSEGVLHRRPEHLSLPAQLVSPRGNEGSAQDAENPDPLAKQIAKFEEKLKRETAKREHSDQQLEAALGSLKNVVTSQAATPARVEASRDQEEFGELNNDARRILRIYRAPGPNFRRFDKAPHAFTKEGKFRGFYKFLIPYLTPIEARIY